MGMSSVLSVLYLDDTQNIITGSADGIRVWTYAYHAVDFKSKEVSCMNCVLFYC